MRKQVKTAFGRRLKYLRLSRGMSQQQLGKLVDLTHVAIGYMERSPGGPLWGNVLLLAKALGVPVTAFLSEDEQWIPPPSPETAAPSAGGSSTPSAT